LVASRADTLETVSGLMNLVMLPMWIGSGIFFSVDRFPQVVQPAIQLLPLTPLIDALRLVMLEGVGFAGLGIHLSIIVGWGALTFALALRWFRWT
jgi:ABC-type polysaccharide/polyol phosphate export permease